ncbi:MAG: transglycosylase SLT domain-containing protein [Methylomicrobium sp.]
MVVLTIVIVSALVAHRPAEAAISSKSIKHKAHSLKKTVINPIDVWTRIRSGMKIPPPIAINTLEPAKKGRVGFKDAAVLSRSSATAAKIPQSSDGLPFFSKSSLNAAPEAAAIPAVHRYTELGRAKLGPHRYTEFGGKLLGAKTSVTAEIECTSPSSVQKRKAQGLETDHKIALLKLEEQIKIGNAHGFRQKKGSEVAEESTSRRNKVIASLSKPIRAGESIKTATPCAGSQLAANEESSQQKRKANLIGKQNSLAGQPNKQAAINGRIDKFIAAYTRNPDFLYRVAERAHPYLYHIIEELGKYQLPLELVLLPIVESAYQATAESAKSARGLWQFIPSTGMDYNLVQRHDYDERLDILKSTQAAIRFLSGLNSHFNGDWLLALAAYNSGQATVDNAISRNRAEGLPADFWSLDLPEETRDYVPRLLALAKIIAHPFSYGIKLPAIKNEPYFVKVKIDDEFDVNYLAEKEISTIAKLANLPHDHFRKLNPGYLGSTLSPRHSYAFLMPLGNANQLRQRLASIAQFMSEPVLPFKSMVPKEKPKAYIDFSDPTLSLVSELVFSQPSAAVPKFGIPFLSLNVEGEQSLLIRWGQSLT